MTTMHLTFGEWLRDRRKAAGMTQESLAASVGLTKGQVSRLESGLRKATVDAVLPLIEVVNADPAEAEYWLQKLEPVHVPAPMFRTRNQRASSSISLPHR